VSYGKLVGNIECTKENCLVTKDVQRYSRDFALTEVVITKLV